MSITEKKKNQHYDTREEFKTGKATVNLRGYFGRKKIENWVKHKI